VLDGASVGASVSVHSCAVCGDSHPATHSYPTAQPQVQSVEPAVSKQIPPAPLSHPCEPSLHGWNVGALLGSEVGSSDGDADGVLDCAAVGASDGSSLGASDGDADGVLDGRLVGASDGSEVGALVQS